MGLAGWHNWATGLLGFQAPGAPYQSLPDSGVGHCELSLLPHTPSSPASHQQLVLQLGHGVPLESKICSFKFSCPH